MEGGHGRHDICAVLPQEMSAESGGNFKVYRDILMSRTYKTREDTEVCPGTTLGRGNKAGILNYEEDARNRRAGETCSTKIQ